MGWRVRGRGYRVYRAVRAKVKQCSCCVERSSCISKLRARSTFALDIFFVLALSPIVVCDAMVQKMQRLCCLFACDLYEDAFSYNIVGTLPEGSIFRAAVEPVIVDGFSMLAVSPFFAVQYDPEWFAVLPDKAGADEAATVKSLLDAVVAASAGIPVNGVVKMIEALWASQFELYHASVGSPGDVNATLTQLYECQMTLAKLDECQEKLRVLRYRLGYRLGKVCEGRTATEEHPSKRHCSKRLNDASQWEADSDASVKSASSAGPLSPP